LRHAIGISAIALACAGSPAFAQSAEEETPSNEIIVTAQFRQQNLQDTPLAITAVNAELLEARGATSITNIAAQAPNVTLTPQGQQNGSGLIAFIRGVGQTDFNFALEPGVGIYVDDVYIPTLTGSLLDLMDLDRVEVLRGPQGTLAGRNSIGGAIKLFSQKPRGDGSGSVSVKMGSFGRVEGRAMADFSVVPDQLAARISVSAKSYKGHVKRLDYGLTHPGSNVPVNTTGTKGVLGRLGGQDTVAGKLALRWTPSERVEINLSGDYTRDRGDAGAGVLLYANRIGANANGQPWLPGTDGARIDFNCRFVAYGRNSCDTLQGFNRKYVSYGSFLDRTPATTQAPYKPLTFDPHQNLDNYGLHGTVDVDLADSLKLTSITAWRRYVSSWSQDVDNTPLANQQLSQRLVNRQWSQELRLTGQAMDEMLDFTVGGIYFKRDGTLTARVDLNYAGIDFVHGPDPTPASSKAVFGNFTFHATDAFNITAGLRQTWDKKDYLFRRRNPDLSNIQGPCVFFQQLGAFQAGTGGPPTVAGPTGIGNQPNCLIFGLNNQPASFKGDRFDWRVAADYRLSPELMVYAQVATGYRSGGMNPRPFNAGQIKSFKPEVLTSYEAGIKTDLFDRALRFNLSGFINKYDDIILTLSACPTAPCLQPNNVGKADVKGFEIETTIRPVENFTIDGALSYLDFKYTKITGPTAVTLDMITPYTPKWKWSFGVQYDMPDVMGGTVSARFDGSYQSKVYTEAVNYDAIVVTTATTPPTAVTPTPFVPGVVAVGGGGPLATVVASNKIKGYFLGNARLGWKQDADDAWSIALEVNNVFNKYYFTSLYEQFASPGSISGAPGLPRTWAVSVKKEF
jgi:iron complex outermembrane receptor protein